MNKGFLKRLLPLFSVLPVTPWPIAYAYDSVNEIDVQEMPQVTVAQASVAPIVTGFGEAINSLTPGDLFYIDALDKPADMHVNLYLTNTHELVHYYRSMILKVGIYVQDSTGQREKASGANGQPIAETFITMLDSQVSFRLAGFAKYKLTIDSGSVYSFASNSSQGSFSPPQFYLAID